MSRKIYAGIGSRKTPDKVLKDMERLAKKLAFKGYTLRSGNCRGADHAFQKGANTIDSDQVELYLPFPDYEESNVKEGNKLFLPNEHAYAYLRTNLWCSKNSYFHARNVQIVLGEKLNNPVDFLVCWTPEGRKIGGTRTGIIVAEDNKIPIVNFANPNYKALIHGLLGLKKF
jgi:hypothetical protein